MGRTVLPASLLASAVMALTACGGQDASSEWQYRHAPPGSLVLAPRDTINIGERLTESVFEATDFARADSVLIVLDRFTATVGVYDLTGQRLFTFGRKGNGPGELQTPFRVVQWGDRLLIADLSFPGVLRTYDSAGRFAGELLIGSRYGTITSLATTDGKLIILQMLLARRDERMYAVRVHDKQKHELGRACEIPSIYYGSSPKGRLLSSNQFGSVAVNGTQAFCAFTVTPVVQVVDLRTYSSRLFGIAPPFYAEPGAAKPFGSKAERLRYLSTWTTHERIYPYGHGFASVYSRYNMTSKRFDYWIFACASLTPPRCASTPTAGKPLLIEQDGTVFIEQASRYNDPLRVVIYRTSL